LKLIEQNKIKLFITKEILNEIEQVIIRPKFYDVILKSGLNYKMIIHKILSISNLIENKNKINICRDKKDNKFIECAVSSSADYLISRDNDLLSLKNYKNIKIIKTIEFLKILKGDSN
jgi:uncharacterized protein